MGWCLWLSSLVCLLLNSLLFDAHVFANSFNTSYVQSLSCHDDERSALLQFKQSILIDRSVSVYDGAYPKILSWKPEGESSNCCSWDGVECDEKTGHVIGLVLESSCLYGSINSNSSLFRLVHLQKLNLADNHFNYSLIPSAIGQLSGLTYLDLSDSRFSGQIPSEMSCLSKLTYLDLSTPFDPNDPTKQYRLLELRNPSLRSLIQNITSLETLLLTSVYIPSTIPDFIANFTSLKGLALKNCGLKGEFTVNIFHLPSLQFLNLGWNKNLFGYLPEFHPRSPLQSLVLSGTSFSGFIPSSIEKLESLQSLFLRGCRFSRPLPTSLVKLTQLTNLDLAENYLGGPIPSWLGNLSSLSFLGLEDNNLRGSIPPSFQKLTKLTVLYLYSNQMSGPIPSWLGTLTQLNYLRLEKNNLNGCIPSSFQNLSHLTYLGLGENHISGPIPTWIGNLTQLVQLYLHDSELNGSVPHSLTKLTNLQILFLRDNNLSGTVEFGMLLSMRSLVYLELSRNKLSLRFDQRNQNESASKFSGIGLGSCSLSQFPNFLRYQNKLLYLDLSLNKIQGQIPYWMWNTSLESLTVLDLHGNLLVDFHQPSPVLLLPWINLLKLDLSFNMLQGRLPIPPKLIRYYNVKNNSLIGEIPMAICNFRSLRLLDLSLNNFSGMVPQCLGKFNFLSVLSLRNNSFQGAIPQVCARETDLRMMDLSHNKFKGRLPRSLASCKTLEYLDLENNQLIGGFPTWLGTLPELKLLSLRNNKFYGVITKPEQDFVFPKLRVIDISVNNFTGNLPSEYLLIWNAMSAIKSTDLSYLKVYQNIDSAERRNINIQSIYVYSTTIVNKGVERYYEVIQENFADIDFSCNKFNGEIPKLLGNLKALRSLNLSFNILTGSIPSSLANLTELESLDLSNNKLSGEIPQQLAGLTFLQSFDVSHNNLTGPIPQGNQFGTFENTSFKGNPGLCGIPLSKKCEDSKALPLPPSAVEEDDDSGTLIELDWKFILAGGISGFVVGVALGDIVITKRQAWFLKAFGRIPPRMEIRQLRN
ncbi:hypothetical protein TIFTF001_025504 [Ficus carica]|uniref:Leucine-rich repeat-containing N-terminal plant-type domain-containing protein n=1 Tax=Ficus carica TaxID=3494 RepID=A0AA88DE86_FICCA|nr:hypothetical protein TIFTF001_025504 [Ficus carica]